MVSSCPTSWTGSSDVRQKCEQPTTGHFLDRFPVSDTDLDITFKNRYCSICHGRSNHVPWVLEYSCADQMIYDLSSSLTMLEFLMLKLSEENCKYQFKLPDDTGATLRRCYQEFNYTLETSVEVINMTSCENRVFTPIRVQKGYELVEYYRNFQCMVDVYGSTFTEFIHKIRCFTRMETTSPTVPTLTSLIDVSSLFRHHQEVVPCSEKEVWLSDEIGCRRLYCPISSEPFGGKCQIVKRVSNGLALDLVLKGGRKIMNERMLLRNLLGLVEPLSIALNTDIGKIPYNYLIGNMNITDCRSNETGCYIAQWRLPIKVEKRVMAAKVEVLRDTVYHVVRNYTDDPVREGLMEVIEDVQNMSCKCNVTMRNPSYVLEEFSANDDMHCPAVKIDSNKNDSSSNPTIRNQSTEATGDYQNFSLGGISIDPSDVFYVDGEWYVCVDTFVSEYQRVTPDYDTTHKYRIVINTICSSLSIIGLVCCLLQYRIVPILRDGKSDLLMILVVFLLLSQTCFMLLANHSVADSVCDWLGMFHHFTWLGSFVFMFLCLFRLNIDIRTLESFSKRERSFATIKYTIVGISVPLAIVLITKLVNVIATPTTEWYGGRLCFLTQRHVLLFAFVVPVSLALCGNVVLFICIFVYISSTSMSGSSSKNSILISLKISTIMGVSWIIGLVAVLLDSEEISLLFEILSNLQGLFITLSFTCNARVRKYYNECFLSKQNSTST
ncbi:uncharacterized protein [Argopecten irradians]|uniref:uncharacterized protein n=1 Tax=Argopecten irradians TaxID=31199 RepID=UPI0037238ABC